MKLHKGFSLIELTAVVAILGITALVVIPSLSPTDPHILELAAYRLADALRYARSEALRTGEIHGVLVDTDNGHADARDILVFKADTTGSPFGNAQTLTHPITKQPYDLWLGKGGITSNVEFAKAAKPFSFAGVTGPKQYMFFNAQGVPVWLEDGVLSRFTGGDIELVCGNEIRTISIQPISGRVSVQ